MSLTIKYMDVPEGAQEAASVSGRGLQPFSDAASMVTGAPDTPWASIDFNGWPLDGTREILPDDPENIGWWSESPSAEAVTGFVLGEGILGKSRLGASRAGGFFEVPPVLAIDFSERFSATGVTINFSDSTQQWCSEIIVRWFRAGELLAECHEFPDAPLWSCGGAVDSFDRITIELLRTNIPGQMARIQQITVGKTIVFGREEIVRAQLVNEADHTLGTLSVDTSRFEVLAPGGLEINPQQNQRVALYRDSNMLATHYIRESTRETAGHYVLSCQSAIGMLEDDFLGGIYEKTPVDTVLSAILDGWQYEIDPALEGSLITGYIPVCSRRSALQQVAFTIGAVVVTHGSDRIKLVSQSAVISGHFTADDVFPGATLERSPRVARYEVTVHRYKKSSEVETLLEDEALTDDDISDDSVLVTFGEPHWDYSITGGEIVGSGVNWIRVKALGAVTVTAKKYTHTTSVRTKTNPDATHAERSNVVSVTDATLINSSNAKSVLNRLFESGRYRHTMTFDAVVSDQVVGDLTETTGPWSGTVRGVITAMDSTLTQNGHTATVTIVGEEVT